MRCWHALRSCVLLLCCAPAPAGQRKQQPNALSPVCTRPRNARAYLQVVTSGALPADRVKHLTGGVFSWNAAGLPMVGDYDASAAGRTPAAAVSRPVSKDL